MVAKKFILIMAKTAASLAKAWKQTLHLATRTLYNIRLLKFV